MTHIRDYIKIIENLNEAWGWGGRSKSEQTAAAKPTLDSSGRAVPQLAGSGAGKPVAKEGSYAINQMLELAGHIKVSHSRADAHQYGVMITRAVNQLLKTADDYGMAQYIPVLKQIAAAPADSYDAIRKLEAAVNPTGTLALNH